VSDGTIALAPLACTRRACSGASLEGPFLDLLSTARTVGTVSGTILLLDGPRGQIVLRR
jgi:heat shock protein HslJ